MKKINQRISKGTKLLCIDVSGIGPHSSRSGFLKLYKTYIVKNVSLSGYVYLEGCNLHFRKGRFVVFNDTYIAMKPRNSPYEKV